MAWKVEYRKSFLHWPMQLVNHVCCNVGWSIVLDDMVVLAGLCIILIWPWLGCMVHGFDIL